MNVIRAILLGIVQGLLEFLPVSSGTVTGTFASFVGFGQGAGRDAQALLHIGTLIALIFGMRRSIGRMLRASLAMTSDLFKNLENAFRTGNREGILRVVNGPERRLAFIFWIAALPSLLAGYLLRGAAAYASASYLYTAAGFFITAVMLGVCGMVISKPVTSEHLTRKGWILGLIQGICVLPGMSRFGCVYAGAVLCGYGRKSAVGVSYLLSIPFLTGAILYSFKGSTLAASGDLIPLLFGMAASCAAGFLVFHMEAAFLRKMRPGFFAGINAAFGILYILLYSALG